VTYYLEKKEEENEVDATNLSSRSGQPAKKSVPKISRKEQRKIEAEIRQKRNKVLKPLQEEFKIVEAEIAKLEAAQSTLTDHMSKPEVTADSVKMHEASQAYTKLEDKLSMVFTQWEDLSKKIEKLEAELS